MKKTLFTLFLVAAQSISAQSYFYFDNVEETIVSGVTPAGILYINTEGELTIPSTVVKVLPTAFSAVKDNNVCLSTLIVEGDVEFLLNETVNALADVNYSLTDIELRSSALTTEHIATLLTGLNNTGTLQKIDIYNDTFPLDFNYEGSNLSNVKVVLPAARVDNQIFGNGKVYGRFIQNNELSTFCGRQIFRDTDDGSNLLFYIPTEVRDAGGEKKIYIQRVRYLLPNQGLLLHNTQGSSQKVELERITEDEAETSMLYGTETNALYPNNMLKGVLVPTAIAAGETKDAQEYTNMILYNGSFYRTSGGTLGANRAYLQMPTDALSGLSRIAIAHPDETTEIEGLWNEEGGIRNENSSIYDLSGRIVNSKSVNGKLPKGIYIQNGKTFIVK